MNIDDVRDILKETNLEFQVDKDVFNKGDHIMWVYFPDYTDLSKFQFLYEEFDVDYAEVSYSDEKEKIFVKYALKEGDSDE